MKNSLPASEGKVFVKNSHKMTVYSEAWRSSRDLNLKNPLECHFSFCKKISVGRMALIQSALHSPGLGECFTYSERMRTTYEKVSTGF